MSAVNQPSQTNTYDDGQGLFDASTDIALLAAGLDAIAVKLNADTGVTDTNYAITTAAAMQVSGTVNAPGTIRTIDPAMIFRKLCEDIRAVATAMDVQGAKLNLDGGITVTNFVVTQVAGLRTNLTDVNLPGTANTYDWRESFRDLAADIVLIATRMDALSAKLNADDDVDTEDYAITQLAAMRTTAP